MKEKPWCACRRSGLGASVDCICVKTVKRWNDVCEDCKNRKHHIERAASRGGPVTEKLRGTYHTSTAEST